MRSFHRGPRPVLRRRVRHTLLALPAVAFLAASAVVVWVPAGASSTTDLTTVASAAPGGGGGEGETQTKYGPLSAADRDFLVKVWFAGSWEGPAGRMALAKSKNPLIQEAGRHLIAGHTELDAKVNAIGRELNVELPDEPSDELKGRMAAMDKASTPEAFDQIFVDMLRSAHGGVYQLLAKIRAGTRNSLIRQYAERCMTVVLDHITVLEKTGMVDWTRLPWPPSPTPGARPEDGMVETESGLFTAADRDFLVKVQLAGLWEGPSGRQAQERAGSQAVKLAGEHLIDGHAELDATVAEVATRFGVVAADRAERGAEDLDGGDELGHHAAGVRQGLGQAAARRARQRVQPAVHDPCRHPQQHGPDVHRAGDADRAGPHHDAGEDRAGRLQRPAGAAGAGRRQASDQRPGRGDRGGADDRVGRRDDDLHPGRHQGLSRRKVTPSSPVRTTGS